MEVFVIATLRDLPDIERLQEEGLLQPTASEAELDGAFGLSGEDGSQLDDAALADAGDDI